jgi:hypothetical protein
MAYRMEARGRGKPTKVPYAATKRGGPRQGFGSSTSSKTWGIRSEAEIRAADLANGDADAMTGIGIALGALDDDWTLVGIDLDSCLDESRQVAPWAATVLEAVDSYAEISPSGRGLKTFFLVPTKTVRSFLDAIGVEPDAFGTRRSIPGLAGIDSGADHGAAIEVYAGSRFFTVTENRWDIAHQEIGRIDATALERLAALIPAPAGGASSPSAGGVDDGTAGAPSPSRGGFDNSRSARAVRAAIAVTPDTYEVMVEALRNHSDPDIAAWVVDKGEAHGERELKRIWNRFVAKRAEGRAAGLAELEDRSPVSPVSDARMPVKLGDSVQWTSGDVDQFPTPQLVCWISEDGTYARVAGSMTGIPTAELTVVNSSSLPPAPDNIEPVPTQEEPEPPRRNGHQEAAAGSGNPPIIPPPPEQPPGDGAGDDDPSEPPGVTPLLVVPPEFSDEALALRFSALHHTALRYVAAWGCWLMWAATYWRVEDTLRAFDLARAICRRASWEVVKDAKLARAVASAKTVAAVERLARADRRHASTIAQWDSNSEIIHQPAEE